MLKAVNVIYRHDYKDFGNSFKVYEHPFIKQLFLPFFVKVKYSFMFNNLHQRNEQA